MQNTPEKFLFTLVFILASSILHAGNPIRIGVLANRGTVSCLEKWTDTADYLSEKIPGETFRIVPLDFQSVLSVANEGKAEFFLVNSSMYIELEALHGAKRIATLSNSATRNIPHSMFGGVVFFKRDQNPDPEWADLTKSRVAAVNPSSFGGWLAPLREMNNAGLNSRKIFEHTEFLNNEDEVVFAVRDGRADAGIVRTDQLEQMDLEGRIRIEDFAALPWEGELGTEIHEDVAFLHSTRLYPEWAIARALGVSDELAKAVAIALLEMPADSTAAKSAGCSGWALPMNYNSVRECLQELRVRPFEDYGSLTFGEKIREHGLKLLIILTIMIATVWILFLKRLITWRIQGPRDGSPVAQTVTPGFTSLISVSGPWIIIGLVFICLMGNYILRNHVVLPRFRALEFRDSRLRIADCVDAVERELHHLATRCHDWAFWDDTYNYMADLNSEFIESNMSWPELYDSGIDILILCDLEGQVVWKGIHHPSQEDQVELADFSVERFSLDNPLIQASWPAGQDENSGFFLTEYGPLMVASSNISTSDGESPSRGTMIFGQFLGPEIIESLSGQVQSPFSLTSPKDKHEQDIFSQLSPGNQVIDFPDKNELVGYGLLSGMNGEPEFMVKMRLPREIMRRGRSIAGLISLIMFSAVVLISVGLLVWFTFLLVESVRRRRLIEAIVDERTADLRHREEELRLVNENLKIQTEYAYRMAAAAEEANNIKSTFISNMGHEIRTPMQAVLGFAELILKTDLSPKQSEYLQKIRSSTKSLSGIVKDILDFSRIEKGHIQVEATPFILDELKSELEDIFVPAAELKGLDLDIDFDIKIRRMLVGDPLRLRQILSNLLANAVKFTREGTIVVKATVLKQTEDSVQLKFSVTDTGIGISEEQMGKIFAAFRQVDDSKTRRYGGIGIGLAVAERLADLMGGKINVESELDKGSVFSFTLRLGLSKIELEEISGDGHDRAARRKAKSPVDETDVVIDDEVKKLLAKLAIQLEEGDAAAINVLKEMVSKKSFPGAGKLLKLVSQYNFEGALDQLRVMAGKAGINLDPDA